MIKVNSNQRGNNILPFLHKSIWHYEDTLTTDYEINDDISILFLSIRFHVAKPEYIHRRYKKLSKYKFNVLLVRVDSVNYESIMLELFDISNAYGSVMVVCFSDEECGNYFTAFNVKNKSFMKLRKKCDTAEEFLKVIPKVNKNDVEKIFKGIDNMKQLIECGDEWLNKNVGVSELKIEMMRKYFKMKF